GLPAAGRAVGRVLVTEPVQWWRAVTSVDLRDRCYAVYYGEHYHAAPARGDSAVRRAQEGRSAGGSETHPVHPLPDGCAGVAAGNRRGRDGEQGAAVPRVYPACDPG